MTFSTGAGFWRTWGCPRRTYQVNHMIFILFSENIFQLQMIRKQSARIHQSLILCRRLTGVHLGEVGLQLAHSPLQKAADGLVGVFLVGGLDDEGHRVLHHALVHAARGAGRPCPALLLLPGNTTREPSGGLRAGSAAGAELPGGAAGTHPRAGTPGTAATGDRNLVHHAQGSKRNNATPETHPSGPNPPPAAPPRPPAAAAA